jgi:ligand-binding sensor domain-containing protein
MIIDTSGNLWVSTIRGISKFNGESSISSSELTSLNIYTVYSMLQDKSGNIWFGTDEGGVFMYNGRLFRQFTKRDGLVSNSVLRIIQDKARNLWFATDVGVSKYDGKSFSRLQMKN